MNDAAAALVKMQEKKKEVQKRIKHGWMLQKRKIPPFNRAMHCPCGFVLVLYMKKFDPIYRCSIASILSYRYLFNP